MDNAETVRALGAPPAQLTDPSGDDGKFYKIDLAKMFAIAKASGSRGYFSMEWDHSAGDPFHGTEQLIKESLRYLWLRTPPGCGKRNYRALDFLYFSGISTMRSGGYL